MKYNKSYDIDVLSFKKFPKTETSRRGMHRNLRGILAMSQVFGLLPVQGIFQVDASQLKFSWKSARTLYSLALTALSGLVAMMAVFCVFKTGAQLRNVTVAIFYSNGFLIGLLFLILAKRWPCLMEKWQQVESCTVRYNYPSDLSRNIIVLTLAVLAGTIFEHVLAILKAVNYIKAEFHGRDDYSLTEEVINVMYPFIMNYVPYSVPLAVLLFVVNTVTQFSWNFMDLFVMIVSTALAERFSHITARIEKAPNSERNTIIFWKDVREDYNILCKLFDRVEDVLSHLICVSFASNLGLILIQLFQSLHRRGSGLENFYFFSCFGLLVLRTIGVTILAARVNDESKRPLHFIADVSADVYSHEVERFMTQIYYSNVALTGWKIFSITRGLICSIAGTIVTYELLLFQFNVSITNI